MKYICFALFILFSYSALAQTIVINEIMSSNQSSIKDEDSDESDWIEIYNNTDHSINLNTYYLSDDEDNIFKWAFPDTIICSKGFILVFASGKNKNISGRELHTNFSIKAEGEELVLSNNGIIIHSLPAVMLKENTSYGFQADASSAYVCFHNPTPGKSNCLSVPYCELIFSTKGGIYDESFTLTISNPYPNTQIRYTIDGNSPTFNSLAYAEAFEINNSLCTKANINQKQMSPDEFYNPPDTNDVKKAIVIRAAAFDNLGNQVSEVFTNSYFIQKLGIEHHLPIISICAENKDLFDYYTGIFVPGVNWYNYNPYWSGNYFQRTIEWEKKISVEFYENPSNLGFKQTAGLRTHGGNCRRNPQKGLSLFARAEYGTSKFNYATFPNKSIASYKRLVLKPISSSWTQSGIEDYLSNKSVINTEIDYSSVRPVIMYLNGEYWGIYFLQEKIDEHYIEENYNIDNENVEIVETWSTNGPLDTCINFNELYSFVENNDLSDASNYETIGNWIDIDNFIDFQIFEIFIANYDWPQGNFKIWREKHNGSKWRWIFFDGDAGFSDYKKNSFNHALDSISIGWPTNARATLFFRKLMANSEFSFKFFNRMEYLINYQFNSINTKAIYNCIRDDISNEIKNQILRYHYPNSYESWQSSLSICDTFISIRPCKIMKMAQETFNKSIFINECFYDGNISELSVFPNPNNGNFNFSFTSTTDNYINIELIDISGKILATDKKLLFEGENTIPINETNLPIGPLFIRLNSRNQTFTTKILCYP